MRTEIEQLRAQQQQSERVIAALVSDEKSDEILEQTKRRDIGRCIGEIG